MWEINLKHVHFIVKQEVIDGLDTYKSRYVSRTQLLEEAIVFFTAHKDAQAAQRSKGSAARPSEVDWRDNI